MHNKSVMSSILKIRRKKIDTCWKLGMESISYKISNLLSIHLPLGFHRLVSFSMGLISTVTYLFYGDFNNLVGNIKFLY